MAIRLQAGEIASVAVAVDVAPVRGLQDSGGVILKEFPMLERTKGQLQDDIAVRLAGTVAEGIILGERSAGVGGERGSDLHAATLIALRLEASYGLGDGLAYLSTKDEEELITTLRFDRALQGRVDKVLTAEFARARQIIEDCRSELQRLVELLLLKGAMTGAEVLEIVGDVRRDGAGLVQSLQSRWPRE